ncbi:MAG: hypothetical protein HN392_07695 [Anaerolineae bacterium]|jgi:tetratricopeptide (TPR) repeat protein|nr:hypothetical protein [Anaerolineae bacterium]MBT7073586.1 hypothetical protein [Anaerolineae bacterium]MBT7781448.1 hypothetical protein [Anaerolineae bacterium]
MLKKLPRPLWILIGIIALIGIYNIPAIHSRLSWRVDNARTTIKYYFNPPDEAIFQPSTPQPTSPVQIPPTLTATPKENNTPEPTLTPTIVPTALPELVDLDGVTYVDQHHRWNYCGPANLTMALNFWGWQGDRDDIAKAIKPGIAEIEDFIQAGKTDKNVMPYEMVNFVNEQTQFRALSRIGGDINLLRNFVASGFPVIVEKGYYEADYTGKVAWLGHYQFVTGYDDAASSFIVQDTYNNGPDFQISYDYFEEGWRSFDYIFVVIYPPQRAEEVGNLLGLWQDEAWARQYALEIAEKEETELEGNDQFFAIFNQGTSLVALQRYGEAATTYDRAFALYAELGQDDTQRPYRIIWYQTGPYFAYYHSARYQDVINLADNTLNETISEPTLEESLFWRARAEYALGNYDAAYADMRETVRLNPNFSPATFYLELWDAE